MADSKEVFKPGWRALDANGNVLSGAYIEAYEAGTDTPRDLYSDVTAVDEEDWLSIGPVVTCDSGGYPTSDGNAKTVVYTGVNPYKLKLYTSTALLVWEHDYIPGAIDTSDFGGDAVISTPVIITSNDTALASSDRGALYHVNCTGSDITITLASALTLGDGWRVGIRHEGTANQVKILTTSGQIIRIPAMLGVVDAPTSVGTTTFCLTKRGQEVWLRCDGAGFSAGETTPSMLRNMGIIEIADRLSTPPVGPADGARYIVTTTPTDDWSGFSQHDIVEADGQGGWIRYTPYTDCGWITYVQDEDVCYQYRGTAWALIVDFASQSDQETGTSLVKVVAPGTQKHHPAHPKAWGRATLAGVLTEGHGFSSVTDNGTGWILWNLSTNMSTANYAAIPGNNNISGGVSVAASVDSISTSVIGVVYRTAANQTVDPSAVTIAVFGDQ